MVVPLIVRFLPSEEELGTDSLTNTEMGRRVNCMSSTFKQFVLEAWLMKRKTLTLEIQPEALSLRVSGVLF